MTILPKKKQNKNSDEDRDKDHSNDRYNYGQISNTNQNGQISPNNRAWASRSDDKRSAPEADCGNDHSNIGNGHLKRRHRSNRERDINSDIQRSLRSSSVSSVRSKSSSLSSPSSSPHDLNNTENDLAIPGCSGIMNREESELNRSSLLVSGMRQDDENKDISGYNSGDEYQKPNEHWTSNDWEEKERSFERKIRKKGFIIKKMCEDGACLFRAVADQVYGDQDMHSSVRKLCMDYMEKNCDYFSQYVTETFTEYIQRKRSDHIHGNHIEIQALSEIFNRPIQVYHYSTEPINTFQGCDPNVNEPIRLSYHRNVHYNSMVNPFKATIGVGLGLPGFQPGLAEKNLMEKALRISEQHELEKAMLEDKMRASDWEATNEAIEEQIARESYLEWLHETQLRTRKKTSATSTLTKYSDEENANANVSSPKCYSPRAPSKSPPHERDLRSPLRCPKDVVDSKPMCSSFDIDEASSFIRQVPPSALGLNDWEEDDDVLARVLAQSQEEYIESLKNSTADSSNTNAAIGNTGNASSTYGTASTSSATLADYYSSLPSTSSNYRA